MIVNNYKFTKWILAILLIFILLFTSVACGNQQDTEGTQTQTNIETNNSNTNTQTDPGNNTKNTTVEEEAEPVFPVTITDGFDRSVTIEKSPERIVSLIPSNTEILYALGYGDQIVGVTDNDTYPEDVLQKEKVGGMELDLEKIISLTPDLVFANQWHQDAISKLEEAGLRVVVTTDATSFEDVYKSIRLIATATGTSGRAEEIISDMKERYQAIVEKAKDVSEEQKKKVWVEISPAPELYTTGKGTFMHEMLEAINAANVAGDQDGWPMFTEEQVVSLNPDVIIVNYSYIDNAVQLVKERAAWAEVTAIKEDQVYQVNEDIINRPGPRLIEGLETIAQLIYPDIFQ